MVAVRRTGAQALARVEVDQLVEHRGLQDGAQEVLQAAQGGGLDTRLGAGGDPQADVQAADLGDEDWAEDGQEVGVEL